MSGTHFDTLSSRLSLPSSSSSRIAAAVNCFEIDAIWYFAAGLVAFIPGP